MFIDGLVYVRWVFLSPFLSWPFRILEKSGVCGLPVESASESPKDVDTGVPG